MITFHERIKASTDAAHAAAETAPFIANLMAGELNPRAYRDYLLALLPIYERMEELLLQSDGVLTYFDHRALDRAEAIKADLEVLNQQVGDQRQVVRFESVDKYLELLTDEITPSRLLAHHYIRYLGDLSGGLVIAKLVGRHYQIPSEALAFYDFAELGDIVFYKRRYRDLLNLVDMSDQEREEFLDEVTKLYFLSREIFIELGKFHQNQTVKL